MIGVSLVSYTQLDLGPFMEASMSITGQNHVQMSDNKPGLSRLADDLNVLRDFSGKKVDLAPSVMYAGFLIAGMSYDVREIVEFTRGMTHLQTAKSLRHEIECLLICGSLYQWSESVLLGTNNGPSHSGVRKCFNQVYTILVQKGLGDLFDGFRTHEKGDGTFLLLENK